MGVVSPSRGLSFAGAVVPPMNEDDKKERDRMAIRRAKGQEGTKKTDTPLDRWAKTRN